MTDRDKCIIIDLDGTLCPLKQPDQAYADLRPNQDVVERLRAYRDQGYYIIIHTSRHMRTYQGNLGLINAHTAGMTLAWLDRHAIPYDELYFGKPWPGTQGFYVDDRAIRPDEFLRHSPDEVRRLLSHD